MQAAWTLLAGTLLACSSTSRPPSTAHEPTPPTSREPTPPTSRESPAPRGSAAPATSPAGPRAVPGEPTNEPAATEAGIQLGSWKNVLTERALSIAIGKRRVAVLTAAASGPVAVWMRSGDSWKELQFPARFLPKAGQHDSLEVYFGRDDLPRVMGYRQDGDSQRQLYYRWKGSWDGKPGEIGRLDSGEPAALFGILGHDDPEVVCKIGDLCIIKRLTGWTMVPVPSRWHAVEIAAGSAYAVGDRSALRIDARDKAWRAISDPVPWKTAQALWPFADGTLWAAGDQKLHHWDGSRWRSVSSPVEMAGRAKLWGRAPDDVWLATKGGAAHYDGQRWQALLGPVGPLNDVNGSGDEVWLVGAAGVWVAKI